MIQQVAARSVVGIASVRGRTGSKRANVTCSLGLVSRRLHTESGSRRQGAQISVGGPGRTLARGARSVQICGASSASQAVATPVPKGAAGTGPVILWFKRDLRVDDHDALVALGAAPYLNRELCGARRTTATCTDLPPTLAVRRRKGGGLLLLLR